MVLIANLLYPLSYSIKITANRKAREELIAHARTGKYIWITLPESKYKTALRDEGKELNIDGRMYDIVSVAWNGKEAVCTVLADDLETSYKDQLKKELKKEHSDKSSKNTFCWYPVFCGQGTLYQAFFISPMDSPVPVISPADLSDGHTTGTIKPPQLI
jgi:hypothetical protein